jgi:hypothetical protein
LDKLDDALGRFHAFGGVGHQGHADSARAGVGALRIARKV